MSMDAGQEFELAFMSTGLPEEHMHIFASGWIASASILAEHMKEASDKLLKDLKAQRLQSGRL